MFLPLERDLSVILHTCGQGLLLRSPRLTPATCPPDSLPGASTPARLPYRFMLSYSTPMQFVRIAIWSNLLLLAGAPIANQMLFMTAAPLLSSFRLFYYGGCSRSGAGTYEACVGKVIFGGCASWEQGGHRP